VPSFYSDDSYSLILPRLNFDGAGGRRAKEIGVPELELEKVAAYVTSSEEGESQFSRMKDEISGCGGSRIREDLSED
jgi:hypothetical protein